MTDAEKDVPVWGIFPPYRVSHSKGDGSVGNIRDDRFILYRDDVEVTRLDTRYLRETDEAARQLREAMRIYEQTRIMTLAMMETAKETP